MSSEKFTLAVLASFKTTINLLDIGSIVKIDVEKIKDKIPEILLQSLVQKPFGTVIGYKITDGVEIGFIVKLSNGETNWFFNDEVIYQQKSSEKESGNETKNLERTTTLVSKKDIWFMVNPINFSRWLLVSTKDIF